MRIVSSNSDEEIAAKESIRTIKNDLRELAANLLRVIRGAGAPYQIPFQVFELATSLTNHAENFGRPVSDEELAIALDFWPGADEMGRWSENDQVFADAQHMIVRGALQIAAASLLEQRSQKAAGSKEMREGIRYLAEHRKSRLAETAAAARAAKPGPKRSKRKKRTVKTRRGPTKPANEQLKESE